MSEQQCKHEVEIQGMNFYRTRQCKNNAIEGSEFCKKHQPKEDKPKVEKNSKYKTALYVSGLRHRAKKYGFTHDDYCNSVVAEGTDEPRKTE